jgi:hypothetical protein
MKRHTTESFIIKSKEIHGNKYSYEKSIYNGSFNEIIITCPIHGDFLQTPANHLRGCGCGKCAVDYRTNKRKFTSEQFIEKAKKIHGDKFDYSKVEYVNKRTKVCIICNECGNEFWQRPGSHLQGKGCKRCSSNKLSKERSFNTEYFIKKAKEIHGDKFGYERVIYKNRVTPVEIECKIHGYFKQRPFLHLYGCGCQLCRASKLEEKIGQILNNKNIDYETQKTFEWLRYKKELYLDIFIKKFNIAIECQGRQHYIPVDFAGRGEEWAKKELNEIIKRDKMKYDLCKQHNISVLYVDFNDSKEQINKKLSFINNENTKIWNTLSF